MIGSLLWRLYLIKSPENKKMPLKNWSCSLGLLLFLSLQPATAAGLYEIEVLVFNYRQPLRVDGERFTSEAVLSELAARSIDVERKDPEEAERPEEAEQEMGIDELALQQLIEPLPAEDLQLTAIRRYLERSEVYQPILHIGWRQPSFGDEQAIAVRIANFAVPESEEPALDEPDTIEELLAMVPDEGGSVESELKPGELIGWVRLRTSLYLHIDADLFYGVDDHHSIQTLRLRESRRVKFKELHYFDHPWFAMLVQVRSVSPDQNIDQELLDEPS
jgi:hypothetical protein